MIGNNPELAPPSEYTSQDYQTLLYALTDTIRATAEMYRNSSAWQFMDFEDRGYSKAVGEGLKSILETFNTMGAIPGVIGDDLVGEITGFYKPTDITMSETGDMTWAMDFHTNPHSDQPDMSLILDTNDLCNSIISTFDRS